MISVLQRVGILSTVAAFTLLPMPAFAAEKGQPPSAHASGNTVVATGSSRTVQGGAKPQESIASREPAQPAVLPALDDGFSLIYERACTSNVGESLDPATCVRLNARCTTEEDGVLVNWIEVNNNVAPPTQTPTGRSSCIYPGQEPEPPVAGEPAEAPIIISIDEFQSQPIVQSLVISQPQNFGLKNAHSNVYAQAQEQEFAFEFQDAQINLRAWPVSYEWNYGDGSTVVTTDSGGPVAGNGFDTQTLTSHQYLDTGDYTVTLTTYFAGDYSVNGGPFQPVAGQASVASAPHVMSIWRTEGHNVSQNCFENPAGIGCQAPISR